MRYGEGLLEEIRQRTDLVALVGRRVKLTRKGRTMWGCCPFHGEKSPSFKVENERRTYKCFGCGKGGDCFRWLTETEGLSFPESVEKLAAEAGVELPKWSPDDEARQQQKKTLYDVVELAAKFFEAQLFDNAGREARDYLKGRGLDGAAAKQFRLGYSPSGNNALIKHLTEQNVTLDDIIAAGLARPAEVSEDGRGGRPMRDFFYNRLMFTIADGRGRAIAFGARALEADAKPKYINTGETSLFSKGSQLYNFSAARAAAIKAGTIIVAEGYMDVIALVRAGFAHAVAPLGTALTEDQLHLLWRTAPEPILAFDGDAAGLKAAHRAAHVALPHLKAGHSLRFAFLPTGEDPDSYIAANGAGAMNLLLENALPLSQLLWRAETEGKDLSTPERRAGLEHNLRELVSHITDAKIADYYRRGFDELVFENFKRRSAQPRADRAPTRDQGRPSGRFREGFKPRPQMGTADSVSTAGREKAAGLVQTGGRHAKELELGRLLVESPEIALVEAETLAILDLQDPSLDRLRHELLNLAASGSSLEKAGVQTHFTRKGMADLLARFAGSPAEDPHASFQRAVSDLRELAGHQTDARRLLERRKERFDRPGDGRGQ